MVLSVSNCGSILVVARGDVRESLNLRVPPDLKRQVEAYAQLKGISVNAAACVLAAEGVRAEERRRRR
jgi:predicted HicB family RNase H-like nuclease